MARELSHHQPGDPKQNNPNKNRFDKIKSKKHNNGFERIAFVMQGGGSLGSYQMGVVKALLEHGLEPDWIAATSIGAIQAAIIVGNPPKKRIQKLQDFWEMITVNSCFDFLKDNKQTLDLYNSLNATEALMLGQPHFFTPRLISPHLQLFNSPDCLSFYDTAPLKKTLLELVDFDLLNSGPVRLSLGSVRVDTGQLIYFNNINYIMEPEHIMASGSLPPGFPATKIDGHYFWDGGVHSNTPLEVILDAHPACETLCFIIDCFGGTSFVPKSMGEISERAKDIQYSTHAKGIIKSYMEKQELEAKLMLAAKKLTEEDRKELNLGYYTPYRTTLAHICYSSRLDKSESKDYDFGRIVTQERADSGYLDAQCMLKEESQWNYVNMERYFSLYEAPNNVYRLLSRRDN
jgi:NTE family protein